LEREAEKVGSGLNSGEDRSKWSHRQEMHSTKSACEGGRSGMNAQEGEEIQYSEVKEAKPEQKKQEKVRCVHCGFKNHASEDCNRKMACETCGLNNHSVYECRRYPCWNDGPELCVNFD
jgi:hypothetical protein